TYRKPGLYVQGYTDTTGLDFTPGFNLVDVISTAWGKPVVIDPMADQFPDGTVGDSGNAGSFFDDTAANGSYDLTGLTVTEGQINELDGTTAADAIIGSNTNDQIRGFDGVDDLDGGAGDDVFVYGAGSEFEAGEHVDGG